MISTSTYIATSLDGFIARKDGSIDWLIEANAAIPQGEDCGYSEFMRTVDVLVMGRNTYEQAASFPSWPYKGRRVIVLTSRSVQFRQGQDIWLEESREAPHDLLKRLSSEGCRHAYIDGGKVIQSFLSCGLLEKITVTIIPVLIGEGRALFGNVPEDIEMELINSKAFDFGFLQATYLVRSIAPK